MRLRSGLFPKSRWGSLQRSPDPLAGGEGAAVGRNPPRCRCRPQPAPSLRNSFRRQCTWQMTPKTVPTTWRMELRQFTLNAHLGWVNMSPYNFFICGPKLTICSCNVEGAVVHKIGAYFSDLRYVDLFRRYSRSKMMKFSEIAPNFGRFFALPKFRGRAFQKLYPFYHP